MIQKIFIASASEHCDSHAKPIAQALSDAGFEVKRWRYDAAKFRRDSVQTDEASGQHEYNDVKLVDELFSILEQDW